MPKTYNETRVTVRYTSTNAKGETEQTDSSMTEKDAQKELEAAQALNAELVKEGKEPKPEPQVIKSQTFQYNEAESLADISALVPAESEAVNIFNRGYVLKQQGIIKSLMLDSEFAAVEGVYDLKGDAAEVRERRKATPAEKAMTALKGLDPATLAAIIAQFSGAAQAETSATA